MPLKPQTRSFEITKESTVGNKITIQINETPGLVAENLGLATWGSSYVLANNLHRWTHQFSTTTLQNPNPSTKTLNNLPPILELGAGTSLVGLSAAAIFECPVLVTDLEPLMPGLQKNITINAPLLSRIPNTFVQCGVLDWTRPEILTLHQSSEQQSFSLAPSPTPSNTASPSSTTVLSATLKFPLILAADTVYAEDHPTLLPSAIKARLAPGPHSRVILCYVLRHSYIDIIRELWENLENDVGLECLEEGKEDPDPDQWDDVAPFEWCVWRWKQGNDAGH